MSSSVTSRAPSPAPRAIAPAVSSRLTAARFSWTRSPTCRSRPRPRCSGRCRNSVLSASAGSVRVQVDVRVIAATNKSLDDEIRENRFREDLYFRLAVIPLQVPPLRERQDDVPLLIEHFVALYARELGRRPQHLEPEAMASLMAYEWPGNVRELRNFVERMMIMVPGEEITPQDLPPADARRDVRNHRRSISTRTSPLCARLAPPSRSVSFSAASTSTAATSRAPPPRSTSSEQQSVPQDPGPRYRGAAGVGWRLGLRPPPAPAGST